MIPLIQTETLKGVSNSKHGFHLYGRILKKKLREIADIGFMNGKGTGDAVFILRRLTEKYRSKGKKLFYYSVCIYVNIYIPQDILSNFILRH